MLHSSVRLSHCLLSPIDLLADLGHYLGHLIRISAGRSGLPTCACRCPDEEDRARQSPAAHQALFSSGPYRITSSSEAGFTIRQCRSEFFCFARAPEYFHYLRRIARIKQLYPLTVGSSALGFEVPQGSGLGLGSFSVCFPSGCSPSGGSLTDSLSAAPFFFCFLLFASGSFLGAGACACGDFSSLPGLSRRRCAGE